MLDANATHGSGVIQGVSADFQVLSFVGHDALNQLYDVDIKRVTTDRPLDLETLLHKTACLTFGANADHVVHGIVHADRKSEVRGDDPLSVGQYRHLLLDEKTGEPLVGVAYTLAQADGTRLQGYTDHEGKTFKAHSSDPAAVELAIHLRKPEPAEPQFRTGERTPMETSLDYRTTDPEGQ